MMLRVVGVFPRFSDSFSITRRFLSELPHLISGLMHQPASGHRILSTSSIVGFLSCNILKLVLFLLVFILITPGCSQENIIEDTQNDFVLDILPDTVGNGIKVTPAAGPVTLTGKCSIEGGDPFRIFVLNANDYSICYAKQSFTGSKFIIEGLPEDTVDIVILSSGHSPGKHVNLSLTGKHTIAAESKLSYFEDNEYVIKDLLLVTFKTHIINWPYDYEEYINIEDVDIEEGMRDFLISYECESIRKVSPWIEPGGTVPGKAIKFEDRWSRLFTVKLDCPLDYRNMQAILYTYIFNRQIEKVYFDQKVVHC